MSRELSVPPRLRRRGGLGPRQAATVRALLPPLLGLVGTDLDHVETAVARLDDFLLALIDGTRADEVRQLIDAIGALSVARFLRLPGGLSPAQLESFMTLLFDRRSSVAEGLISSVLWVRGPGVTPFDLARSLRELLTVAYYSNPATDRITGYVPVWRRTEILAADPSIVTKAPYTTHRRTRLNVKAIRAALTAQPAGPRERLFRQDGRPRVAVIGSGPGGAAAAAALAGTCDVVVFEAGPRFRSDDYPLDAMAAMALLYEGGLMTPTRDLDVRVLRPRAVGGGSVMNEGVTVRPRASTLDHWQRLGAGFDRAALERALSDVELRQRYRPLAEDRTTSMGPRWRAGLLALGQDLMVAPVLSDLASHTEQHLGSPHRDLKGDRCLGCGLCNYGCRFGHHLTVDRTFLWDAEQAGALVAPNSTVHHLVSERDPATGRVRVTGLRFSDDPRGPPLAVDHVVLAAGTPGSAALLLRSLSKGPLSSIRPARAGLVGAGFGLNVGAPTIARWAERPERPGYRGIQTHFVATKAGDRDFILENGYVPPAILASGVPGLGADHRRLMGAYTHLGMAVNTIGTASTGRITARGDIDFRVDDGTMDTMRRTLALLIDGWLHAGAVEVWPGGLHPFGPRAQFGPGWRGAPARILARLEETLERPEHLQIGSGHPQGGLGMNDDPERGVVSGRFRVHDTDNLFVADASLFPTTIVVNLQWLVLGLGLLAGRTIATEIAKQNNPL